MGDGFVIASSALFFVPALISAFRQQLIVTITFTGAALFSTLYHSYNEQEFTELDVIWASLAILVALLMLAVLVRHYRPWHWRVSLPLALGLTALILYFVEGRNSTSNSVDPSHYNLYHSLWHLFVALSALVLVWTPVDLRETFCSYASLPVWRPRSRLSAPKAGGWRR